LIFVDTSAWFALIVAGDRHHDDANRWFTANSERLYTTDYIVDETLTLLRSRRKYHRAVELGEALIDESLADLHHISRDEFQQAFEMFKDYADKDWSFTKFRNTNSSN
jgi:predicted nucleic acid-binding protein